MSTLIVVGFKKDMYRASQVLNELVDMNYDWTIDLDDAVAAYRDYNGKLRIDASYQLTTGEGAALGGLFGSLIGLTLGAIAAPVTAGASAAAAAGVVAAGAVGHSALRAAPWMRSGGKRTLAFRRILSRMSARWCSPATRRFLRCCVRPIQPWSPRNLATMAALCCRPRSPRSKRKKWKRL